MQINFTLQKKVFRNAQLAPVSWITISKEGSGTIKILIKYSATVINKKIFLKQTKKVIRTVEKSLEMVSSKHCF
jgi:hypothetical protein